MKGFLDEAEEQPRVSGGWRDADGLLYPEGSPGKPNPSVPAGAAPTFAIGPMSKDDSAFLYSGRGARWLDRDEPGVYVRSVRAANQNPPEGTTHRATDALVAKYGSTFDRLVAEGPGTTVFGPDGGSDRYSRNSFDIPSYPEESLNRLGDSSYHKYGVLTYLGPVDTERGITKDFIVKEVLRGRYSYPGKGVAPVKMDAEGKSQVYAVAPWNFWSIDHPRSYTYPIGVIEQMEVPDGVLNITTEKHDVYPGTIRRAAIERNGHLFTYTSGAGENNYNNIGAPRGWKLQFPPRDSREGFEAGMAAANDYFGPRAFRALDREAFNYVESIRKQDGKSK